MGAHGNGAKTLDDIIDRKVQVMRAGVEVSAMPQAYEALANALAIYNPVLSPEDAPVPSGHVYLAQLMAHDLILSAQAPRGTVPNENLVARPLMLETIYGSGPDAAPHLYALPPNHQGKPSESMRVRRTFRPCFRPLNANQMINTDLPRARCCPGETLGHEAIIADRRNDSHSILAQITAQWMRFHNVVFERSKNWVPVIPECSPETFFRERFHFTQAVVRARWHAIIKIHVLPNLLSCDVRDKPHAEFTGMPDVSARIALRSLHCLARSSYTFAYPSVETHDLKDVLNTGSHGRLKHITRKEWQIYWPFFFQPDQYGKNGNAARYRAVIQPQLRKPPDDPSKHSSTGSHVSSADLCLALLAGASASVPEEADLLLPDELKSVSRAATIAEHLNEMILDIKSKDQAVAEALKQHVDLISREPPLVLVLLLEADKGPANGRHLGKFGSSLLAPWILGALARAEATLVETLEELLRRDGEVAHLVSGSFKEMLETINKHGDSS